MRKLHGLLEGSVPHPKIIGDPDPRDPSCGGAHAPPPLSGTYLHASHGSAMPIIVEHGNHAQGKKRGPL